GSDKYGANSLHVHIRLGAHKPLLDQRGDRVERLVGDVEDLRVGLDRAVLDHAEEALQPVRHGLDLVQAHGTRGALGAVGLTEAPLEERTALVVAGLLEGQETLVDGLELLLRLVGEGGHQQLLKLVVGHAHDWSSSTTSAGSDRRASRSSTESMSGVTPRTTSALLEPSATGGPISETFTGRISGTSSTRSPTLRPLRETSATFGLSTSSEAGRPR